jgi:hypothetical protein
LIRVLVAALVVAVFAGCGGTASSLEDAAEATGAETSRVAMTHRIHATETEKEYVFESEGVFDYPNDRAVLTTSDWVPFYGEDIQLREVRMIGKAAYWRWVIRGKTYWTMQDPAERSGDPAELLIPGPGTATKPTDVLTRALLASEGNEELGQEEVRGEETTHHRARVNLNELIKQLPASERPQEELLAQFGGPVVPVDLWIDAENRLRKIVISRPARTEGNVRGPGYTATVELYDYGVDVDVEPPEGERISEEKFQELTGDWLTTTVEESGEGEVKKP